MKKEQLFEAIEEIKDSYIQDAYQRKASPWVKWGSVAACLAVVFLSVALFASHSNLWSHDLPATEVIDETEETAFGTRYIYKIASGTFTPYVGGKVIDSERIGEKLEDVTVTAGWITDPSQEPRDESLRGEIYEIQGVSPNIAVALWFLDKGDALTTTHYYVILNPEADLSPVADYVIPEYTPDPKEE